MADAPRYADSELHHQLEPDPGGEVKGGAQRLLRLLRTAPVQGVQGLLFIPLGTYFFLFFLLASD